ncbi:recombination protein NinG [Salmonella enterica]|nr:recombination protein NinG [Salmonella enterica]EFT6782976.1 recombination protein NinG [Salmonella enterica]EGH8218960.1 recombination protein NinG [Salmonella enterica]EID8597442.1 recombination protein NinG [Salmonella enterica]EII8049471.1 recombination protein NinG [Salmonella enterica]
MKPRKPRICKVCGSEFVPYRSYQKVCGGQCALVMVRREQEKKKAKEEADKLKVRRQALKPRSYWIKQAQSAVNQYIRERDRDKPCVSCGTYTTAQWDAGHYRTIAAAPQLRFDERNIHKQCVVCNQHKSGNLIPYRAELIRRIGSIAVEIIENNNERHKWTIEECKFIRDIFRAKLRDLRVLRKAG